MASNRYISTFSFFATIVLLVITVVLGFAVSYINFSNPMAWLFVTLFIGCFVTFIRAIYSINKLNKLSSMSISSADIFSGNAHNKNAKLTTCPDYWTKKVVIDPNTDEQVIMCYNEHIDADGNAHYLGGTLELNEETVGAVVGGVDSGDTDLNPVADTEGAVFNFSTDSIFSGNSLDDIRAMANTENSASLNTDTVEGFKLYSVGNPGYNEHRHSHEMVKRVIDGKVYTSDESKDNVAPEHTHTMYYGRGYHSHDRNEGTGLTDLIAGDDRYKSTNGNFENWISPYKTESGKYAIELNLKKLNQAHNTCELASNFVWSDVMNNCAM